LATTIQSRCFLPRESVPAEAGLKYGKGVRPDEPRRRFAFLAAAAFLRCPDLLPNVTGCRFFYSKRHNNSQKVESLSGIFREKIFQYFGCGNIIFYKEET